MIKERNKHTDDENQGEKILRRKKKKNKRKRKLLHEKNVIKLLSWGAEAA